MKYFADFWKGYVDFGGRTNRRGYWMAYLFNALIIFVLYLLAMICTVTVAVAAESGSRDTVAVMAVLMGFLGFVMMIYGLAIFLPSLAITVRRLRDSGREWYFIFMNLIPLVGGIIMLVLLCQPSVAPVQRYDEFVGDGAYDF